MEAQGKFKGDSFSLGCPIQAYIISRRSKLNMKTLGIEHFLMDFIQILFRDWIKNTIDDIGRCKATTDILKPTLRNFFYKRCPIIFFYGRGRFFVRCCRKNLQCRSARFISSSSTEVVLWPTPACFLLLGKENISQPRKKKHVGFTDTDRKKC